MTRANRCAPPLAVVTVLAFVILACSVSLRADGPAPAAPVAPAAPRPDVSRTLALTALPRELVEYKRFHEKLHGIKVTLVFREESVANVVELLTQRSGVNIVFDTTKLADPDQTVTLKFADVPLDSALNLFTEQVGLAWDARDGVVFISNLEGVHRPPVTAVYNVRDLVKDGKIRVHVPEGAPDGVQDMVLTEEEAFMMLIDVIKMNITPGTWEEGSGNAISAVQPQGCIVVTHAPAVHAQLQEFLELLRRARDLAPPEPPKK